MSFRQTFQISYIYKGVTTHEFKFRKRHHQLLYALKILICIFASLTPQSKKGFLKKKNFFESFFYVFATEVFFCYLCKNI